MDEILMEEQIAFEEKMSHIKQTNEILDELQNRINEYFHHNSIDSNK
jgi:hypothetical protein